MIRKHAQHIKIKLLFTLSLLFFSGFLVRNDTLAQQNYELGSPFIQNYTPKDYDADPQNWCMEQDHRDLMYFGNTNGILEYDGNDWRLVQVSNFSLVRSLALDSTGTICVGAVGEFGYLASTPLGELRYISLMSKLKPKDRSFTDVNNIFATANGVYFFTNNKVFHWYKDRINVIPNVAPRFGSYVYGKFLAIQEDRGLFVLRKNKLRLLPYTRDFIVNSGNCIIMPYTTNKLLVGTEKNGFYIYDLKKLYAAGSERVEEGDEVDFVRRFYTDIDGYIRHNGLQSSIKIDNNTYAFATKTGGIVMMDQNGKLLQIINKNRGLQNNNVHNLFLDRERNLWAALEDGISKIETISPITHFSELNGLESVVLSTTEINGIRYAGTTQGIYYLPRYNMNVEDDKHVFESIRNIRTACWSFHKEKRSVLALLGNGIARINAKSARVLRETGKTYDLTKSKKFPNLLFISRYEGLSHIEIRNAASGNVSISDLKVYEDLAYPIWNITSDQNGNLWLATLFSGIMHIKFNSDDINDYKIEYYDYREGLPRQLNNPYVEFRNNILYVATPEGIYKTKIPDNPTNKLKFSPENSFGQYFNENKIGCKQLYFENENRIWINSENGVGLMERQGKNYNWKTVPFKNKPTYLHKFFIDNDGIAWICTNDGLYRYNPKIEVQRRENFNALIRNVTVGKDSIIFYGTNYDINSLRRNYFTRNVLEQPKELIPILDHKYNSISFEFSAATYEKETDTEFKYMLVGFDKEWSKWSQRTSKEYTNLPEGTYYFKVKARNIFGKDSKEAVYKFYVEPPWYRHFLAYAGYIILFGFILYSGIKIYTRRLEAQKIRLEKIVEERTAEISQQKEEIQSQAEQLERTNKELEKLSIVARETDNAVIIMNEKGDFEWVNEGFTRIFGLDINELVQEKSKNIIGPNTPPEVKEKILKCIATKETVDYEFVSRSLKNKEIWVQATLTPIVDELGNIKKLIAIDSDITRIKNAEQAIKEQAQELKKLADSLQETNDALEQEKEFRIGSIRYALTIQRAILPIKEQMDRLFDSFILFRPKDIVSGDFYWYSHISANGEPKLETELHENDNYIGDKFFLAAVDCTGHGVPGAFMSMIGNRILNEIVNERKVHNPKEILNMLNNGIKHALKQDKTDNNDGMDVCLCMMERQNQDKIKVTFTGAKRPLFYFKKDKNHIETIRGDRKSIGGVRSKKSKIKFTNQEIILKKGDVMYLTTDGIIDQNAPNRKRFSTPRLVELLNKIALEPLNTQRTEIENALDKHQQDEMQRDDITLIGLRLK